MQNYFGRLGRLGNLRSLGSVEIGPISPISPISPIWPIRPCYQLPVTSCQLSVVGSPLLTYVVRLLTLDVRPQKRGWVLWRDFCAKQEGGSAVYLGK